MKKRLFMLLSLLCAFVFMLSACQEGTPVGPDPEPDPEPGSGGGEYSLPLEDGMNQLTIR